MSVAEVIWHDLECGSYVADLPLWCSLVERYGDPVLEIGAGTGRVALHLARAGYGVTALDQDERLLAELAGRAEGLELSTVAADARHFELGQRFASCLVPMQAIQLFGGPRQRAAFLRCAARHLVPGGVIAVALADELEYYEVSGDIPAPLPDVCEREGVVYCSQPTAVRGEHDALVLERRRETISASGARSVQENVVRLDRLTAAELEREAAVADLRPLGRAEIDPTPEHCGSTVVILGA